MPLPSPVWAICAFVRPAPSTIIAVVLGRNSGFFPISIPFPICCLITLIPLGSPVPLILSISLITARLLRLCIPLVSPSLLTPSITLITSGLLMPRIVLVDSGLLTPCIALRIPGFLIPSSLRMSLPGYLVSFLLLSSKLCKILPFFP